MKAKESNESTVSIVKSSIATTSKTIAVKLPSVSDLIRTIQRTRSKCNPQLPTSASLHELIIPDTFQITLKNKQFLLMDYIESPNSQFVIFVTRQNLKRLSSCDKWFADGTFSTVPSIFKQLYTIHGLKNNEMMPVVYVLTPSKSKKSYKLILECLLHFESRLNPLSLMVDYEKSFLDDCDEIFPNTEIHGCHFHFSQCIWRKVQKYGFRQRYSDDKHFALNIKKFIALSFVPSDKVIMVYELLISSDSIINMKQELKEFIQYFEKT